MERIICLVVGYVFGLIQTGYIYGKTQNIDIRKHGSGNAGTTNALRTMGWKAGAITFIGDCIKCIVAVTIVHLIYSKSHADIMPVLAMYAGMGAVLGHNYPFYMNFKGGKGIATSFGLIICTLNPPCILACFLVFVLVVAVTKYVSAASLSAAIAYTVCVIVYGHMGGFQVTGTNLYEIYIIGLLLVVSAFYKHKANIQRLMAGTENKISVGKKK